MTTLSLPCEDCRIRGWSQIIILWLVGVLALGASGQLAYGDGLWRLAMPTLILLPIVVYLLAWARSARFRETVLSINTGTLVILHSWRMIGAGFLFLYAYDVLPGLFAWLAGVGDMLAAVGAVLIGTALLKGETVTRRSLLRWNTFGLLDFVIAVMVGLALTSNYLGGAVNTDPMATLPLSLIPTVAVPLFFITHLMIYQQLRANQDKTVG